VGASRSKSVCASFAPTNPTVATMRAKLDAAILAEAWSAVTTIAARIREIERVGVADLDVERAKRQR
jgi:hypothetical protein